MSVKTGQDTPTLPALPHARDVMAYLGGPRSRVYKLRNQGEIRARYSEKLHCLVFDRDSVLAFAQREREELFEATS